MADNPTSRHSNRAVPGTDDSRLDGREDQFVVRSLARGLKLLALFTVDHPEWSLAGLVREINLPKATVYRITRTMEAERYLIFNTVTGMYHLGPSVVPLTYLAQQTSEFEKIAKPFLERLAAETGETANLGIEMEGAIVITGSVLTSHVFKSSLPVGRVLTDLSNAHAKVYTAYKSPAERAKALAKPQPALTPHSLVSPAEIEAELDRVAEEGVGFDMEEHGLGVCSAAAPVRGQNGTLIATVSVVAPKERFGPEEKERAAQAAKKVAADFSAFMGYEPR